MIRGTDDNYTTTTNHNNYHHGRTTEAPRQASTRPLPLPEQLSGGTEWWRARTAATASASAAAASAESISFGRAPDFCGGEASIVTSNHPDNNVRDQLREGVDTSRHPAHAEARRWSRMCAYLVGSQCGSISNLGLCLPAERCTRFSVRDVRLVDDCIHHFVRNYKTRIVGDTIIKTILIFSDMVGNMLTIVYTNLAVNIRTILDTYLVLKHSLYFRTKTGDDTSYQTQIFFIDFLFAALFAFPPLVLRRRIITSDKAVELHSWLVGSQQKLLLGIGSGKDGAAQGGVGGERGDGSSGYSRSHQRQQQQQLQRSSSTASSSFKRRNAPSRSRYHRSRLLAVATDFSQRVSSREARIMCVSTIGIGRRVYTYSVTMRCVRASVRGAGDACRDQG